MNEKPPRIFPTYKEFKEYLENNEVLEFSKRKPFNCPDLRILPENVSAGRLIAVVGGHVDTSQFEPYYIEKNSLVCVKMCGIEHYSPAGNKCTAGAHGISLRDDGTFLFKCGYDLREVEIITK